MLTGYAVRGPDGAQSRRIEVAGGTKATRSCNSSPDDGRQPKWYPYDVHQITNWLSSPRVVFLPAHAIETGTKERKSQSLISDPPNVKTVPSGSPP